MIVQFLLANSSHVSIYIMQLQLQSVRKQSIPARSVHEPVREIYGVFIERKFRPKIQ
jgi:hypothetical protein